MKLYEKYFPLRSSQNLVSLLKQLISNGRPPDIAYISLLLGNVEHSLSSAGKQNGDEHFEKVLSTIDLQQIHTLYKSFCDYLKEPALINKKQKFKKDDLNIKNNLKKSKRSQIKDLADVVWSLLARNYRKDRPHMQSLYSLLKGG